MNRRKFISVAGGVTIGLFSVNQTSKGMDIQINAFQNDVSTNLDNINTIKVFIREIRISSFNIDDSKNATLSIYGDIGGNNVGKIKEMSINVTDKEEIVLNNIYADIKNNQSEFEPSYFDMDNYKNRDNVTIDITFKLNHPDINEISEQKTFVVGFTDGEIDTYTYNENNVSKQVIVSSTETQNPQLKDILIWSENRTKKLQGIIGNINVTNKSSYLLPKGGIDSNYHPFSISPPSDTGEIQSSEPNKNRFDIS